MAMHNIDVLCRYVMECDGRSVLLITSLIFNTLLEYHFLDFFLNVFVFHVFSCCSRNCKLHSQGSVDNPFENCFFSHKDVIICSKA